MTTVKKILFPTDFSETAQNAFRYCLFLADHLKARIELLHVIYPEYEALDLPVMAMKATKNRVEAAKVALKSFVELGLAQVQLVQALEDVPFVSPDVEIGSPVKVIDTVARRDQVDLIIMGTKGEHNLLEKTFGSVTTGVIRRAPCHVLVVPEEALARDIQIVAYAADLREADPYHIWEIGKILQPFSPILRVVHVDLGDEESMEVDLDELKKFFENNLPALQINFHQIRGQTVAEALEEFVGIYEVDLMVMFAPHHTIWDRLFHQSQTQKMAYQTEIPLLLIKTP